MTITLLSRIITSRSVSYRLQPTHRTVTNNVTKFLQPWTKNDVTKLQQPWSNLEKTFHTTPPKLVNPLLLVSTKFNLRKHIHTCTMLRFLMST